MKRLNLSIQGTLKDLYTQVCKYKLAKFHRIGARTHPIAERFVVQVDEVIQDEVVRRKHGLAQSSGDAEIFQSDQPDELLQPDLPRLLSSLTAQQETCTADYCKQHLPQCL